jgi:hypothetical protein
MARFWRDIGRSYNRHIVDAGKEEAFWILIAFLVTFLVVRAITHAIRRGRGPFRNLSIGGTHLHHLVPGILLLIVTGYLSNALHVRIGRTIVAVFFGIGAVLTLDEFALWLNLRTSTGPSRGADPSTRSWSRPRSAASSSSGSVSGATSAEHSAGSSE